MAELFDQIDELRRSPGKVAVATLVNTRGTTPRKEGAKMLVGEGGSVLGSVTIGGCVDAQVIEQTEDVLNTNRPRLLELNLGDEEAWEIGLTCGGTIEVFVEPLSADFLERVRAHTDKGGRAAIITRLDGPVGAKILLLNDGTTTGSLGDAPLDERAQALVLAAREAMANAARHSGVDEVSVFLDAGDGAISLYVRDRGSGFDPETVPAGRKGIAESIKGRLERAGGTAVVTSSPGGGTEVELRLPR